jgi:four helix bundle protein
MKGDEGDGDWGPGNGDWGPSLDPNLVAESSSAVRRYEDLRVWTLGVALAEAVYTATRAFPGEERFGLTAQLRRAAVSIPSNIAEGWGRGSRPDYKRFLFQARGSLYEVETQLLLAFRLGFLSAPDATGLREQTQSLSRQLLSLIRALSDPAGR